MCFVFGPDRLTDGHMGAWCCGTASLPLTWHAGWPLRGLGGESLIPPRVFWLKACFLLVGSFFPVSVNHTQLIGITLTFIFFRNSYLFLFYWPHIFPIGISFFFFFYLPPLPSSSLPALALSRCVNQYSLLTHDSPHMSSTAPGLRRGAEIMHISVCVHMSECNFDVPSPLFALCFCVRAHVCVHVLEKSTRLAGLSPKGCCCRLKSTSSPHEWTH